MNNIDLKALTRLSYGLYVLTAREGEKDNGCIVNVAAQVTDNPLQIVVAVNKKNLTHDMIVNTGRFNLSMLTEKSPMELFRQFGFQSGRDVNKFEGSQEDHRAENGIRYISQTTNTFVSGEVLQMTDLGTHTLFIAKVTEAKQLSDDPSLTYAYYHAHIKPQPAPKADKGKWVCQVCGYEYEGDEMPDDFICPLCKHGKTDFTKQ